MQFYQQLESLFFKYKEVTLSHRYVTQNYIDPLIEKHSRIFQIDQIGLSVNGMAIKSLKVGHGSTKILLWSQMHGNESTTTKSLFDLLNLLTESECDDILKNCTLFIVPILNPDGAKAYTRHNANDIDLNRDAQNQSQPESIALKQLFIQCQPDYCFNLHGQRTIFSAGKSNNPATLSFLAPAQDEDCTITATRKRAMHVISEIHDLMQEVIPNQIGIYDDAFNLNCVGDTFQHLNVPTILFEAGHYTKDYSREEVRRFIFMSLVVALKEIATNSTSGDNYEKYLNIPKNEKLFFDIIIRNTRVTKGVELIDIALQYEEQLIDEKVEFIPKIEKIENLESFYAHHEIDANKSLTSHPDFERLEVGVAIDFVKINNEKFSLKLTNP